MEVVDRIDSVILGFFTKISHWFQQVTGRTNFFLAYLFLTLWVMESLLRLLNYWFPLLSKTTDMLEVVFSAFFILTSAPISTRLNHADRSFSDVKPTFQLLYQRPIYRLMRVISAVACVIGMGLELFIVDVPVKKGVWFFDFYEKFSMFYITCYLYFVSVDPLPPGTSKIKQWLTAIRFAFSRPVPVTNR